MAHKQQISGDDPLWIPETVEVCPICGAKLRCEFEEWEQGEDGTWSTLRAIPSCESEPDIDEPDWQDWSWGHYDTPYIDWLPVEVRLTRWVNEHYVFKR